MKTAAELGTLEASGLIQLAVLEPELEYLFRHALVQDAAYASLLKQDRRTLHRLAAETLLATYPDRKRELAAVIAMHYEQAGDAQAAAPYLVEAGEHAQERFANREALSFFERAVALLASDPRIELRLRATLGMAKVGWSFTASDKYVDLLERIVAETADRNDPRLIADAYFWIAFIRRWRGENPETSAGLRSALDNAERIGEKLGDPIAHAIPKAFMGVGMMFSGQLREGAKQTREALAAMEGKADPLSTAILSGFLTMTLARLGDFAAAEETLAYGEQLAAQGDEIARLDATIARTGIELERGELDKSMALAESCAIKSEELGAVACGVGSNVMLGAGRLQAEDVLGAKVPAERGFELALVTNMAPFRTLAQGMVGAVQGRLGNLPQAAADWDGALAAARAMGDRYGEAMTLWNRGRTHARQTPPDFSAAITDLDATTTLMEAMGARPALARVLRDRAQTLRLLGRADDADLAERHSLELARELGLKDFPPAT